MRKYLGLGAALAGLFLFRLAFGLSSDFWTEDERQVYLIGLKSFARGEWPYFGADVVWSQSQIPGALQGLLVGMPFRLWPAPEAPFVLLNLLSFGSLCLFAWYVARRLPALPAWLVWGWMLTAPWVLHFSTHVVNTSYILPASILFFIGYFEALPLLSARLLPLPLAYGLMGFALLYMVQIHMSWVLLPVYLVSLAPFALSHYRRALPSCLAAFALGASLTGSLLWPTVWRHGWAATGGTQRNIYFEPLDLWTFVTIVARFLSFACMEVNRFIELSLARRLVFLSQHLWLVPPLLVVSVVGVVQVAVMAGLLIRRRAPWRHWSALRALVGATPLAVYLAYFLSLKEPLAHAFYVTFPIAMFYGFHCLALLEVGRRWQRTSFALLTTGLVFHTGFAVAKAPTRSLYRDRDLVELALETKQYRLLGERRQVAGLADPWLDGPPPRLAFWRAQPRRDIRVIRCRWARAVGGRVSVFSVTLENRSRAAAYGDLEYATRYFDLHGTAFRYGRGVIKEVVQPKQRRTWKTVVDGMADPRAAAADLVVFGAQKYLPMAVARAQAGTRAIGQR